MKKIGALVITAFYLLLTTGVYTCVLHCTTGYLVANLAPPKQAHHSHQDAGKDQDDDDDCKSDNCNCCYHHGTYVVKENFSPGFDFQFAIGQVAVMLPVNMHVFHVPQATAKSKNWPRATGPPFVASQPIYIYNKTLLI
ncbi:hypothetical protein [Mucilaginibacter ginsenosidivorax]|uniref:Uncharacterized protein n=1 Tax=Mucilaginibacter ginsenosidivorax TaxID=862126 RepID=A0A5B8W790_9SPHI|nr:hypothetical protein [Mucilaginibacter ginsenosidivorax]QEC78805.1 hypothetical protein FSB76_23680 [Mucilaginibacter ginsenosidivorax]